LAAAFDKIDHSRLLESLGSFPARDMIRGWLKAGVFEAGNGFAPTDDSPLVLNVALHGLEAAAGGARSGDLVAILGLGGLGHLGVQFAAKMGYRVAVIARGQEKAALAFELGAHHYIDYTATDVAAELSKLDGARVVQATAANADAISATIDGLALHGELLALAVLTDSLTVSPLQLIMASKSIYRGSGRVGWRPVPRDWCRRWRS
jgi:alcohol dehydrogenase